jgi:hypothetical protein
MENNMASITDGVQHEQSFEIGKDEAWATKLSRTYQYNEDYIQSVLKQSQTELANINAQHQKELASLNALTLQNAQASVENANIAAKKLLEIASASAVDSQTAKHIATMNNLNNGNMLNVQGTAHRDVATDRIWNVDEQANVVKQIFDNDDFISELKTLVAKVVSKVV